MKLIEKVKRTVEKNNMLARGDGVVLAVSGGPDSVALLVLFVSLARELELTLTVAHLNHGLRGRESDGEEEFVRELASRYEVPFVSRRMAPKALKRCGLSLEEAARQARYGFLDEVAGRRGASRIALGHSADDQAETVLMNLIRGAGPGGLQGMLPVREEKYIRPLIAVTRQEIESFLKKEGIDFRVDSSNRDLRFVRNKIRWQLLPYLSKEFNPRIKERLLTLAAIFREENEFLSQALKENLPQIILLHREGRIVFARGPFLLLDPALQFRALRWAVKKACGSLRGMDYQHICQALAVIKGPSPNKRAMLPGGCRVERRYNEVIVVRERKPQKIQPLNFQYPVKAPGIVEIPEANISLKAELIGVAKVKNLAGDPNVVFLDWDKLTKPLLVRNGRPGDTFKPLGMKGKKKLKDFFIDAKVSPPERKKIPLLLSGQEIAWVTGFRPGEPFKVRGHTRRVLRVEAFPK